MKMTSGHFLTKNIKKDYASLQINLPNVLVDDIISWGHDNIPDKYLFFDPKRPNFGREENIHITLLYGIPEKYKNKNIEYFLKNIHPFIISLGKMSLFSNNIFEVLKIDVESPDLFNINSILTKNLEVFNIYPKYIPHVTIAYLKKNKGILYEGIKEFEGRKFKISDFILSSKDRTKHEIKLGIKNA